MRSVALAILLAFGLMGCVDADPPALRTLVTVIATQDGQPVEDATVRLIGYGRRALVVLEAALHTAPPGGRRRLVRAIRRLGDEDGAALLGHVAEYDEDLEVRKEAQATLFAWSADSGQRHRAEIAKKVLAALASKGTP